MSAPAAASFSLSKLALGLPLPAVDCVLRFSASAEVKVMQGIAESYVKTLQVIIEGCNQASESDHSEKCLSAIVLMETGKRKTELALACLHQQVKDLKKKDRVLESAIWVLFADNCFLSSLKITRGLSKERKEPVLKEMFKRLADEEEWDYAREIAEQMEGKPRSGAFKELFKGFFQETEIEKARQAAEKIIEEKDRSEAFQLLCGAYLFFKQEDRAKLCAIRITDRNECCLARLAFAQFFAKARKYSESYKIAREEFEVARHIEEKEKREEALCRIANLFRDLGHFYEGVEAADYLEDSEEKNALFYSLIRQLLQKNLSPEAIDLACMVATVLKTKEAFAEILTHFITPEQYLRAVAVAQRVLGKEETKLIVEEVCLNKRIDAAFRIAQIVPYRGMEERVFWRTLKVLV